MEDVTIFESECVSQKEPTNSKEREQVSECEEENDQSDEVNTQNVTKMGINEGDTVDITSEKSGGVLKKILKEGEGDELPGFGDRVSVHYTGWLLGKEPVVFDSNVKEEKFEFNLGRGMVIKGWDLGISTMKKGETALFICHPKYAYGDMGYPPTIPPRTPLLFEIKLFEWKLDDLSPKKDESILRKVLEKGEGNNFPNEGSQIKVEIIHYIDDDKTLKEEKEFILGEGCTADIPEGLEIALLKFCLNERSLIYLRNKYVENVKSVHEMIDASSTEVKYEMTLLHFEKAKNVWEMNSDEKYEKAKSSKEKGVSFFQMGLYKVALKQFKWIVTCLENEPGVSPETQEARTLLLLSGYLNISLCHQKLKNHIEVIKACNKALAIDPDNEKALFRRGQAKVEMNDCEEAFSDFEAVSSLNPDNKAAQNYLIICQNKIKEQKIRDKSTYNNMFDLFVKQDQERLKNLKTETGVWQSDKNEDLVDSDINPTDCLLNDNRALLEANVIELSNTANGNISYN